MFKSYSGIKGTIFKLSKKCRQKIFFVMSKLGSRPCWEPTEQKTSSIKYFLLCQDWDGVGNHLQQSNMKQKIWLFWDQDYQDFCRPCWKNIKVRAKKLNFQQVYKILCSDFSVNKYTYKIRTRPRNVTCKIFWEWNQPPVLSSVVVCPVSDVLSRSPLSPSFFAAKNILLMSVVTIKLKNLLLFAAATVGLGTGVWSCLAHDALIVLQEVAMKIFNEQH